MSMRLMQLISSLSVVLVQAQRPDILYLHGGGGTGSGFQKYVEDLQNALPEYEFVRWAVGEAGVVWDSLWWDRLVPAVGGSVEVSFPPSASTSATTTVTPLPSSSSPSTPIERKRHSIVCTVVVLSFSNNSSTTAAPSSRNAYPV